MEVTRIIGGKPYDIELSDEEMYQAYIEKGSEISIGKILAYLDNVEEIGGIPSELLQSERFADKALVQLEEIQSDYEENISQAVQMAVDYEIKSNTIEDLVSANTADLIIDRLNQANYFLNMDSSRLAVILKNEPDTIIRSLNQGTAVETVTAGQKSAVESCVSTVQKFKAVTYVGRGINELGDYDDLDPEKDLKKERERNKPLDLAKSNVKKGR